MNYNDMVKAFYNELLCCSRSLGLGGDVSVDVDYDALSPDVLFVIHSILYLDRFNLGIIYDEIYDVMGCFCRDNGWESFWDSVYIVIR